ncbi:zinc finger BED domain-containing protein RICESLEEPER 2-like [Mercurialis annua]|uniref:zinc finger BED domain-containing protein RICESLEEPER 2-like n=1 Tax=Mercurialis annua TaxID=3986 RepID=UPI002160A01E|nr:zinc finger BED domain-containing protein RICESLEEPER 2-like [Mercurialis annua]
MSGNNENEVDNDQKLNYECDPIASQYDDEEKHCCGFGISDGDGSDDEDGWRTVSGDGEDGWRTVSGDGEDGWKTVSEDSETGSVNNCHIDFEERQSYMALAMLSCVEDILPLDGLPIQLLRKHMVSDGGSEPRHKKSELSVGALQAECLNIYDDEKVRAKKVLKNFDGQITLSIDVLRCPAAGEYLCLTAHFIAVDWCLRNWVICFKPVNKTFDDDFLYGTVMKCITDWDIGDKVSGVIVDNFWFDGECVGEVKDLVQKKRKLPFRLGMFRLNCCADLFKLMVQDAFKGISEIMHRVDEYMNFGKPINMWNTVFTNLKEALEYEAKGEWNKDEYENYEKLNSDEWKKVEEICKLLQSLYNAAKSIFEAKQPTAHICLRNLQEVHASLAQASADSDNFISPIARKMLERLDKYLKNMFLVLATAIVMDPRCKMKYLEFSFARNGANDGTSDSTTVLTTIQTLYDDYLTNSLQIHKRKADSISRDSDNDPDDDSDWLQKYKQFAEADNRPIKSELDLYLEEGVLPWSQDFDILGWWRGESPKYPVLSRLARDILGAPVSVVTSQDAYFTVEREIGGRLASLESDVMNAVMCSRSWCPPDIKSKICSMIGDMDALVDTECVANALFGY